MNHLDIRATSEQPLGAWTRIRGTALVHRSDDGSLDFRGAGERMVLSSLPLPPHSRLRLALRAQHGDAYEILVRAGLTPDGRLTALSVRLAGVGRGGTATLGLISDGEEIPRPIATATLPTGYLWHGFEHVVELGGGADSLVVQIDGHRLFDVENLSMACLKAVIASARVPSEHLMPSSRGVGLRVVGDAELRLSGAWLDDQVGTER